MSDYLVDGIEESEDPRCNFAFFIDFDPIDFHAVVKNSKWHKAMDEEIAAIEKNDTWELMELPKNQKAIGVK